MRLPATLRLRITEAAVAGGLTPDKMAWSSAKGQDVLTIPGTEYRLWAEEVFELRYGRYVKVHYIPGGTTFQATKDVALEQYGDDLARVATPWAVAVLDDMGATAKIEALQAQGQANAFLLDAPPPLEDNTPFDDAEKAELKQKLADALDKLEQQKRWSENQRQYLRRRVAELEQALEVLGRQSWYDLLRGWIGSAMVGMLINADNARKLINLFIGP